MSTGEPSSTSSGRWERLSRRFASGPSRLAAHPVATTLALVVLALGALIASGRVAVRWQGPAEEKPREARRSSLPGQVVVDEPTLRASEVRTEPVSAGRIPQQLSLPGEVQLAQGAFSHVTPRIGGAVRELSAEIGAEVSAGTTLCIIESVELGETRAALVAAVAERAIAERNYERWKQLFEKGLRTQNEFWIAENQWTRAKLAVRAAESRLRAFGLDDEELAALESAEPQDVTNRYAVKCPLTGVVLDRRATLGEFVNPQDQLFLVGDLSTVWVVAALHQRDLASVRRGVPARVKVGPELDYPGVVTYVGAQVDERTRTVPLRVTVANVFLPGSSEWALRPSMFASVDLVLGERDARVVVPRSAIQKTGDEASVFVLLRREDGASIFERRPVVLGVAAGERVEVVSGLAPDEVIATDNAHLLATELRTPHGQGAD